MAAKDDIREFLVSRRERISPHDAGLPAYGTTRRVKGLRREEVALLAGISVEYYTRLERGNAGGASEDVLDGVARALHFDEAERAHLFDLVRAANRTNPSRRRPTQERVRPTVQRILDSITVPAYVRNGRLDVLAANTQGRALYAPVFGQDTTGVPNIARFLFLSPRAGEFFDHWERIASDAVAILRAEVGRDPHDRRLTDLIGELSTRSDEFRVRWAAHDVKFHRTGTKTLHHPVVGELQLDYEALELPGDTGQRILIYTAEPASPSADALNLLASWATTPAATPTRPSSEPV